MLVIFYGTSCSGKTTIMKTLCNKYGWHFITTYMTRPQRDGEFEKITVSKDELEQNNRNGKFLFVNHCFDSYYATPLSEIEYASNNKKEFWCLDFPIDKRGVFDKFPHYEIMLLPENEKQLISQINKSNRNDRLEKILDEYSCLYMTFDDENIIKITNHANKIDETCLDIINKLNTQEEI